MLTDDDQASVCAHCRIDEADARISVVHGSLVRDTKATEYGAVFLFEAEFSHCHDLVETLWRVLGSRLDAVDNERPRTQPCTQRRTPGSDSLRHGRVVDSEHNAIDLGLSCAFWHQNERARDREQQLSTD